MTRPRSTRRRWVRSWRTGWAQPYEAFASLAIWYQVRSPPAGWSRTRKRRSLAAPYWGAGVSDSWFKPIRFRYIVCFETINMLPIGSLSRTRSSSRATWEYLEPRTDGHSYHPRGASPGRAICASARFSRIRFLQPACGPSSLAAAEPETSCGVKTFRLRLKRQPRRSEASRMRSKKREWRASTCGEGKEWGPATRVRPEANPVTTNWKKGHPRKVPPVPFRSRTRPEATRIAHPVDRDGGAGKKDAPRTAAAHATGGGRGVYALPFARPHRGVKY